MQKNFLLYIILFNCMFFAVFAAPVPAKNKAAAPVEKELSLDAKLTTQSSISRWDSYASHNLFKGSGSFAFHTDGELNPYIIITLKKLSELTKVIITNRREDQYVDLAKNLQLWISDDLVKWRKVWTAGGKGEKEWTVPLEKESAQYLRLDIDEGASACLVLAKVRIFGFEK